MWQTPPLMTWGMKKRPGTNTPFCVKLWSKDLLEGLRQLSSNEVTSKIVLLLPLFSYKSLHSERDGTAEVMSL